MNGPAGTGPVVVILVENLSVPFDRRVWQEACTLRDAGYRVHVICPRSAESPASREVLDGIAIYRYRAGYEARRARGYAVEYSLALASMFLLLLRIARRARIDIIHVCNPPDLLFVPAIPFLFSQRTRLIFDQHDACPELLMAKGRDEGSTAVKVTRLCERATYWLASVVISPNESYRSLALDRGKKKPEDVFVVRSGPQVDRFASSIPSRRFHFDHPFLAAYVGVMGIQDGVDYLLDAVDVVVTSLGRRDIQFTLAGSGPEYARLCERAKSMKLEDHVRFLGRVSESDLGELLVSADVCVNPDEFNRMNDISTMNKVVEYMAVAKPIVQFDLKEGRVSAEDASEYVAPNDSTALANAICALIDDPERRDRMGQFGRDRLENHLSWDHQEKSLLSAYARATPGRLIDPELPAE
jgi:glycosyltransferase involved in cell wall biosynthesis